MKEGLPEIALRYSGRKLGQLAIGAGIVEVAGFLGNALFYAGTKPTHGNQTMLAHIGTGLTTYNPFDQENSYQVVKDNAFSGLIVSGIILGCWVGSKIWKGFSATQSGGWRGAQESYQLAKQKRAKRKARIAKEMGRQIEDMQED